MGKVVSPDHQPGDRRHLIERKGDYMPVKRFAATTILILNLVMAAPVFAQQSDAPPPNANQSRKESRAELKQQEKSEKAHAKADKEERKALNTKQAKRAAKDQDKAAAAQPPQ